MCRRGVVASEMRYRVGVVCRVSTCDDSSCSSTWAVFDVVCVDTGSMYTGCSWVTVGPFLCLVNARIWYRLNNDYAMMNAGIMEFFWHMHACEFSCTYQSAGSHFSQWCRHFVCSAIIMRSIPISGPISEPFLFFFLFSFSNKPATDRVTGHARGCARERACLKLECVWTRE